MTAIPDDLLVVDAARIPPTPWRNGGGHTRELLAWPGPQDWLLRVSLADITADGPFSAYPGVDRWFSVVQGAGVVLAFPDAVHKLDADDPPLAFDGAAAPGCTLRSGPTRDLNLMTHRDAGSGLMQRADPAVPWTTDTPYRGLFCAQACALHINGQPAAELAPMAFLFTQQGAGGRWQLRANPPAPGRPVAAWWLSFTARPGLDID